MHCYKLQCLVKLFIFQFEQGSFTTMGTDDVTQPFSFYCVQIGIDSIRYRLCRIIKQT